MKRDYEVSYIEKIVINSCTPFVYLLLARDVSYREIANEKLDDYLRILAHTENNKGEIPQDICKLYNRTLCGKIAMRTVKARKYFNEHNF